MNKGRWRMAAAVAALLVAAGVYVVVKMLMDPPVAISKIDVTHSAFDNDGKRQFVIDLDQGSVTEFESSALGAKQTDSKTLDPAAIAAFQDQVVRVGLSSWKDTYRDPNIADGGMWTLVVTFANGQIKTVTGINVYTEWVQPPRFSIFADALKTLVGRDVF